MSDVPHEYGPSRVGHGEAQCKWCNGTNRENAIISPNHCEARAERDAQFRHPSSKERLSELLDLIENISCDCGEAESALTPEYDGMLAEIAEARREIIQLFDSRSETPRDARGFPLAKPGIPIEARCAACSMPMITHGGDGDAFYHDCDCMHQGAEKAPAERHEDGRRKGHSPLTAANLAARIAGGPPEPNAAAEAASCVYTPPDDGNMWLTGCGHEHHKDADLDLYDFCPYCGKPVEEASYQKTGDKHG